MSAHITADRAESDCEMVTAYARQKSPRPTVNWEGEFGIVVIVRTRQEFRHRLGYPDHAR